MSLKLQLLGKLRCDANLRYLYTGVQNRRGRPRKYDGKVALNDLQRFTFVETVQPDIDLCTAREIAGESIFPATLSRVWHVSLKREIRLAYLIDRRHPHRVRTCLLFSNDVALDPKQIYQFYQLRFQIEFIFRDAKQFTGLEDCQARDALSVGVSFQCQSYRTQSGEVRRASAASKSGTVCVLHGKCQTPCSQSTLTRTIYSQLRPGAECN